MGRVAITKELFTKIKRDIKVGLHKQTIANYYHLSYETVRKISIIRSWKQWNDNKAFDNAYARQQKYKSIKDVELDYEEHSNWFVEKLKKLKRL